MVIRSNPSQTIKFYQQNIRGLPSKANEFIKNLQKNTPDICIIQEAFRSLKSAETYSHFSGPHASPYSVTRTHAYEIHKAGYTIVKSSTGRATLWVNSKFNFEDISEKIQRAANTFSEKQYEILRYETCWISLKIPGHRPVIVGSIYRSPKKYENHFDWNPLSLEIQLAKGISPRVIIGADINCKNTLWGSRKTDSLGLGMENILSLHNLQVALSAKDSKSERKATFFADNGTAGCTSVDFTAVSHEINIDIFQGQLNNPRYYIRSDHVPFTFKYAIDRHASLEERQSEGTMWNLRKINWNEYAKLMDARFREWNLKYEFSTRLPSERLDEALERWYEIIHRINYDVIPLSKIRRKKKAWWTPTLTKLRRIAQKARNKIRNKFNHRNWMKWKELHAKYRLAISCAKREYFQKFSNSINSSNLKQLFREFRSLAPNPINSVEVLTNKDGDIIARSEKEKADELNQFCANLGKHPDLPPNTRFTRKIEEEISELRNKKPRELEYASLDTENINCQIKTHEIRRSITELNAYKAMGPDKIHNLMLKNGGEQLLRSLVILFNWSFSIGYFPIRWKRWHTIPIYKNGREKDKVNSYRPIALLSCVGKLLERIMAKRISWYLRRHNLLHKNQAGFRKGHNTTDLLLRLSEDAFHSFKKRSILPTALLDLSNAYDSVWRDGLRHKLRKLIGIKGRAFWWLDSFLSNRKGQVRVGQSLSEGLEYNTGLPQGSPISPVLFIIYINDLSRHVTANVNLGKFADDLAIWSKVVKTNWNLQKHLTKSFGEFQRALDQISAYCVKWKLRIAVKKTQFLCFTRQTLEKKSEIQKAIPSYPFYLNNARLEESEYIKYLGVHFDRKLSWEFHFEKIRGKASGKARYLKALCDLNPKIPVERLKILYSMIVRPTVEYASAIWHNKHSYKPTAYKLESIQKSSLAPRAFTLPSVGRETIDVLFDNMPLSYRRDMESIKLYHRILKINKKYNGEYGKHNLLDTLLDFERTRGYIVGSRGARYTKDPEGRKATYSTIKYAREHMETYEIGEPIYTDDSDDLPPFANDYALPLPKTAPWNSFYRPDPWEIQGSLENDKTLVLYTDGSTLPNPGYGGAAVIAQRPDWNKWDIKEYPMEDIVTNNRCEVYAINKAIKYSEDFRSSHPACQRTVILSDSLTAINQSKGTWKARYNYDLVKDTQNILCKSLYIPEIYHIPAHRGIPGNERADFHAKEARKAAEFIFDDDPLSSIDDMGCPAEGYNKYLERKIYKKWAKDWNDPKNAHEHSHAKRVFPYPHKTWPLIMDSLSIKECKMWGRLTTGHAYVNSQKFQWKISPTDKCPHANCQGKETIDHLLFDCEEYSTIRKDLHANIKEAFPQITDRHLQNIAFLLTGLYFIPNPLENNPPSVEYPIGQLKDRIRLIKMTLKYAILTKRRI